MADKNIIINGVDVSDCEHLGLYKEYKLKCGACYPVDCSDNSNCYYKQFLRKGKECKKAKQTLAEIKEVLQFYNNTTIGTYKGNGIFEFEVLNGNVLDGKLIYCYDTNPAKKALQKISEVIND